MNDVIVNKVSESGIISLDLEEFYPKEPIVLFDLKDYLFMGLILKEKDFRASLAALDCTIYTNKNVGIVCTADAIIPMWANMLIASLLEPHANQVFFGNEEDIIAAAITHNINQIDSSLYTDQRVVVKGCGELQIPATAYVAITNKLRPVAKSIMYGEPCSTVPIYKKR